MKETDPVMETGVDAQMKTRLKLLRLSNVV